MISRLAHYTLLGMASLAYCVESTCKEMKDYECGIQVYSDAELMDPLFIKRDLDPWEVDLSAIDSETNVNVTDLLLGRRDLLLDLEGDALHAQVEALIAEQEEQEEDGDEGGSVAAASSIYHMLTRRGGKNDYQICREESPSPAVTYWVPSYPDGTVHYDNENWKDCTNFAFSKNPSKLTAKKYIAEHVLERQMLQQFAISRLEGQTLPQDSRNTYCGMFAKYWVPEDRDDANDKAMVDKAKKINAWDSIGNAWPSKKTNSDEMLRTENQINLMKARAFSQGTAIVDEDKIRMAATKGEMYKVNNYLKIASQTVRYLAHDDVQATLKKQGDRVAEAFKAAETALEANWAQDPEPYVKQGLDTLWLEWIEEYMEEVSEKLRGFMDLYAGFLDGEVTYSRKYKKTLTKREEKFVKEMEATVREIRGLTDKSPMFGNPWK